MKITVDSGLKQPEIITLLEAIPDVRIRFAGKDPKNSLRLFFDIELDNADKAVAFVKSKIKAAPFGQMIFFSVHI